MENVGQSVAVTGGAGFIGSNFCHSAVDIFSEVHVIDKFTYASNSERLSGVRDEIHIHRTDITNREEVRRILQRASYIVNFAAETHVDRSIEDAQQFVRSNVEGAYVLMDLMREVEIDRMVHISTDEVYGSTSSESFSEEDGLDPSSPYSATKASADMLVNSFWTTYDLPISVVRPSNAYGPRQLPEKLIPKFIHKAIDNERLPVYGDGTNVRQWIYVEDLCEGIMKVLLEGDSEIYNAGGPDELQNIEVTKNILRLLDKPQDLVKFVEDRKGHDQRYSIKSEKLRGLGWSPRTDFSEGLEKTVEWYRKKSQSE